MSDRVKKGGGWLLGLFTAGALFFGVTAAMASEAMTCPDDQWNWVGEQPSEFACISACYAIHGEDLYMVHWNESTHCCACLF